MVITNVCNIAAGSWLLYCCILMDLPPLLD